MVSRSKLEGGFVMKAAQLNEAGGDFRIVDREIPEPSADEVLVKVEACSICHSDEFVKENQWPGLEYPRVPGHEIAGTVKAMGTDVTEWTVDDPVGVGWHGGHCFTCEACRHGDFINCENGQVTGISYDGGYAEYVRVPEEAVVHRPPEMNSEQAAPLLCAGITTYNALRNSSARGGDRVAVLGVGGLGHLALQYADALGCEVVALSTSPEKEDETRDFGTDTFIDVSDRDGGEALQDLGGADVIMATAPSGDAINSVIPGLAREGELLLLGVDDHPIQFPVLSLIDGRKSIKGWPCGSSIHSEETLRFSLQENICPEIETYNLEDANEAYNDMIEGNVRYRAVLIP
jgi:D-arabinose 1-dehydrogenase-like Zn-dependent alcohol dehydrogenase